MKRTLRRALAAVVALVVALLGVGRAVAAVRTRRRWRALGDVPESSARFDPDSVADLPDPARRYLEHAVEPGTRLARGVDLVQAGSFRPGDRWRPLVARQRIAAGQGFVWRARVRVPPVAWVGGTDFYLDGRGGQRFFLCGLLPVATAGGPGVDRSAAERFLAECVWLPTALLPERGASWTAVESTVGDDRIAAVTLSVDDHEATATLTVDDDGRLRSLELPRFRPERDRVEPFRVVVEEERRVDGVAVPTRLVAGWVTESGFEPFVRVAVEDVRFR